MCYPALSASVLAKSKLAISAVSAVAGVAQASSQAQQQAAYKRQNDQAAKDSYILETHLLNRNIQQRQAATSQKKQDNSIKSLQAQASALAIAAGAGTEGASVSGLLDDFRRNEGVISDRLDNSLENATDQAGFEAQGLQAKAQNRVNSVQGPDLGNLYSVAIRGTGSVLSEFSEYRSIMPDDEGEAP